MKKYKEMVWNIFACTLLPLVKALILKPFFFCKNSRARHFIFKLLWYANYKGLFYVDIQEKFLVNSQDLELGGFVYSYGFEDFNKFEQVISILKKNGHDNKQILLVDAGANIGTICIPALARGLAERAIAIEANPSIVPLLKANVALNELDDRIQVVGRALGVKDNESLSLAVSEDNHGDNRIVSSESEVAQRRLVNVQTITFDTVLKGNTGELLIWMDLQGYEGIALQGASRLLERKPPMVMEFWPSGMRQAQSFELLKKALMVYSTYIDLNNPSVTHPISDLDKLYISFGAGEEFTDILLM